MQRPSLASLLQSMSHCLPDDTSHSNLIDLANAALSVEAWLALRSLQLAHSACGSSLLDDKILCAPRTYRFH